MTKATLWTDIGRKTCLVTGLTLLVMGASAAQADLTLLDGCRLLDTRQQGQGPALVGQATRAVTVRGECGIPEEATGIEYNATIVNPDAPGYLTLHPSDAALPGVSSLNFQAGDVLGNAGLVKLGATAPELSVYMATSPPGQMADLVLDVTGYHGPSPSVSVNVAGRLNTVSSTNANGVTVDRWTDNGDGTVTDKLTGLVWEKKTDDSSIHDKDDTYTWCGASCGTTYEFDGTAKTAFLDVLNDVSGGGAACFAGHCDWRLPTIDALQTLIEPASPDCGAPPCTTIPGETVSSFYWSSSTYAGYPLYAWGVDFFDGLVPVGLKALGYYVRAVRGGS